MSDEDWVRAAKEDESAVVELLMSLRRPAPPKRESCSPAMPLEWSVRQRRSKPTLHAANKKEKPTPTASPTTPLSWSGATSVSGSGADSFEESSRPPPKLPEASRSKVTTANEATTSRRPRKKKTLAELKKEEILLVKERRDLKRELARLRVTLENQRATNERLKRLKRDLEFEPAPDRLTEVASVGAIRDQTQQESVPCDPIPSTLQPDNETDDCNTTQPSSPNGSSTLQHEVITQENNFILPDLNLPIEVIAETDRSCSSRTESRKYFFIHEDTEGTIETLTNWTNHIILS
ncbi:Major facilitator superfamily domain-containing protein [Actinidia chinensis var. chinensis]|uniref:Major facilitator superfamily domain-containing protein n=1 Tax=Actinidia chinensis var. chinensis TaxID=1590841 RepID=A0A2R6QG41_ACTCC|nr:Major facilitator superfamily domain-containing protein [Actinidia chinensis var. chinensis]